jgi:hypothetical protein
MDKMLALTTVLSLCSAEASAQRDEATLDHIVIAVHDLDGAGRAYSALGFAVFSGAHIFFYFRS